MTNFIKLQYADDLENYTDQAVFLGAIQVGSIFDNDNIARVNEMLEAYDRGTIEENILPFFESIGLTRGDLAETYNNNVVGESLENYESMEDFDRDCADNLLDALTYDIGEFITDIIFYTENEQNNGINLTEKFIDFLGLQTFTVGYSQWSRVVTFKEHDQEFYSDLYNGWNFYDVVAVDEQGEVIDAVGWIYARTDQELRDEVKAYFGFDSFKLIDNEAAVWFEIEKAEKITQYK